MKSNPFIKTAYRKAQQTAATVTDDFETYKYYKLANTYYDCYNDDLALSVQDLNYKTHCDTVEISALLAFSYTARSSLGRQNKSLEEMRRSLYQSNVPLDFRLDYEKAQTHGSIAEQAIRASAQHDEIDQDWLSWALETIPGSFK